MLKQNLCLIAAIALSCAPALVRAQSTGTMDDRAVALAATAPRNPGLAPVFEQFGGKAGLIALMDDFMDHLMADPRTRPFFADPDVDRVRVKDKLVEQFCVILGGPCEYTGDANDVVHEGLGITRADFNALVEVLQTTMTEHDIPFRAQNKLLAELAPMHTDIITE